MHACSKAHHRYSTRSQEEGDVEKAIAAYSAALALDGRHAESSLMLGALYRRRGEAHNLELARMHLSDALWIQPHQPSAW